MSFTTPEKHAFNQSLLDGMAYIANEEDPSACIETIKEKVHSLAAQLTFPPTTNLFEKIARLNHFVFVQHHFKGDNKDYYNPQNSLLHVILQRQQGLPITLSALYMEIARLSGLSFHGIVITLSRKNEHRPCWVSLPQARIR